jgi:hypothetical protein
MCVTRRRRRLQAPSSGALVLEEAARAGTTAAMAICRSHQGWWHMRTEQQMIREWADGQGEQNREINVARAHRASPRKRHSREGVSDGPCPARRQ